MGEAGSVVCQTYGLVLPYRPSRLRLARTPSLRRHRRRIPRSLSPALLPELEAATGSKTGDLIERTLARR